MLKKILNKISYFLSMLKLIGKVSLGIRIDEDGEYDFSSLIEAGFIWLIGTPLLILCLPQLYNPVTWILIILATLILSNLSEVLELVKENK